MSYVDNVIEQVKEKNPNEPEFIQAVTEVLTSLKPDVYKRQLATIDLDMHIRHEEKKVRRQGGRTKGPAAFERCV